MLTCTRCRAEFLENRTACPACGLQLPGGIASRDVGAGTLVPGGLAPGGSAETPGSLVGRVIDGKYRLLDHLGSGGMATVYRAEHAFTKRIVAVKVLHQEFSRNEEIVRRFEREAQIASKLDHPSVVLVMDFGRAPAADGGFLYLVMEHLPGELLSDRIHRAGGLGLALTLDIGRQVLGALSKAQELGIVHRDLKPDNVLLVERDGRADFVKIFDFGIAKLLLPDEGSTDRPLTQAGLAFGTPAYMSPEQCLGQAVDGGADLYAVGVMLHEMLSGRRPFDDPDPVKILGMQLTEDPPPLPPGVPRSLETIIWRALSKKREQRHASARAMLAELEAVSLAQPSPGPQAAPAAGPVQPAARTEEVFLPPRLVPVIRKRRRWPRVLLFIASVLLSVTAILAVLAPTTLLHSTLSVAVTLVRTPAHPPRDRLVGLVRSGELRSAARLLRDLATYGTDEAAESVILALHELRARRVAQAMAALEQAIRRRPQLGAERAVRQALELVARDPRLVRRAVAALGALVPPPPREELRRIARSTPDAAARRLAVQKLLGAAVADGLIRAGLPPDRGRIESLLRGAVACPERRDAVRALRYLEDPAALGALQRMRRRPRAAADPAQSCLLQDLDETVVLLQNLQRQPAPAAGSPPAR